MPRAAASGMQAARLQKSSMKGRRTLPSPQASTGQKTAPAANSVPKPVTFFVKNHQNLPELLYYDIIFFCHHIPSSKTTPCQQAQPPCLSPYPQSFIPAIQFKPSTANPHRKFLAISDIIANYLILHCYIV